MQSLPGVGPRIADRLASLGIETVRDLVRKDLVQVAGGAVESDDRQCLTWIANDPANATRGR